jgi:hypothetical protein
MQFTEFEHRILDHLLKASAPGKHACCSAKRHLERAWILATSMPELAIFSGITAEEESATALFHVLKKRGYQGADRLDVRSHVHKIALHPFLSTVGKLVSPGIAFLNPKFVFDTEHSPKGKELLRLRLDVPNPTEDIRWGYPLPPLNFTVTVGGVISDFESELASLASENNAKSIFEFVKSLANVRNQALYASQNGIPHVENDVIPFLIDRKSVVFSHFIAFLLIDPYRERQPFVQHALTAFLQMLKRAPQGEFQHEMGSVG